MSDGLPAEQVKRQRESAKALGDWLYKHYPSGETDIAVAALDVLKRFHRVVLTREDLDALPVGAIIRSDDGGLAEKYESPGPGMWPFWVAHKYRIHQKELWPATVIYTPNEEQKQ